MSTESQTQTQTLQSTFTISLNDIETKAMHFFAVNPQEWIETAVQARIQVAMEDIFNAEIKRLLEDPNIQSIPANKAEVIRNAQVKTAKERLDEAVAAASQMQMQI